MYSNFLYLLKYFNKLLVCATCEFLTFAVFLILSLMSLILERRLDSIIAFLVKLALNCVYAYSCGYVVA